MLFKHILRIISSLVVVTSVLASATPIVSHPNSEITAAPNVALLEIRNSPHFTFTPPSKPTLHLPPKCTQTITPDKNGYVPPGTCGALYRFYPSFGAAVAGSVLFGMLMVFHITQAAIYKKGFCWVVIMSAAWEFGSFVTRSFSTLHQQSLPLVLVSQILVLLAPLWVNAFAYMVLARMIYFYLPSQQILSIKPGLLAFVFVTLDFVSFVVQLAGSSMVQPNAPQADIERGTHIYMGGIGLQEFFVVIFFGLAVKFQLEMLKEEKQSRLGADKYTWRRPLYALYFTLIAITVRIIFRLLEFSGGQNEAQNPLPFHEVYFYTLDCLPIFLAILSWNVLHPGTVLRGPDSELPPIKWCGRRNKVDKRPKELSRYEIKSTSSLV